MDVLEAVAFEVLAVDSRKPGDALEAMRLLKYPHAISVLVLWMVVDPVPLAK